MAIILRQTFSSEHKEFDIERIVEYFSSHESTCSLSEVQEGIESENNLEKVLAR